MRVTECLWRVSFLWMQMLQVTLHLLLFSGQFVLCCLSENHIAYTILANDTFPNVPNSLMINYDNYTPNIMYWQYAKSHQSCEIISLVIGRLCCLNGFGVLCHCHYPCICMKAYTRLIQTSDKEKSFRRVPVNPSFVRAQRTVAWVIASFKQRADRAHDSRSSYMLTCNQIHSLFSHAPLPYTSEGKRRRGGRGDSRKWAIESLGERITVPTGMYSKHRQKDGQFLSLQCRHSLIMLTLLLLNAILQSANGDIREQGNGHRKKRKRKGML